MAGGFTPVRGSLPPAAPTVWFCPIADRNTMLFRGDQFATRTSNLPALYANQFTSITGATFDGFITAPDGTTNTMQLIKEDSSTGNHNIEGGPMNLTYNFFNFYPRMRFSGFFKAGPSNSRGRIALRVNFLSSSGGQTTNLTTVYDLANGQIGIAPVIINNGLGGFSGSWNLVTSQGAQITNFGGGVYRCDMDFSFQC